MKRYLIEVTKDQKAMIQGALKQSIEFCNDAIEDNEAYGEKGKDIEAIKELKEERKLMRESLRAVKSAKQFLQKN